MDAVATAGLSLQAELELARHFLEMCISMRWRGHSEPYRLWHPSLARGSGHPRAVPRTGAHPDRHPPHAADGCLDAVPRHGVAAHCRDVGRPDQSGDPLIGLARFGLASESTLQITFGSFCGISCVGMLVVMLFRLDLYTGRAGHHMAHGAHAAHAG